MDLAQLGFEVNPKGLISGQKELDKLDKAGARAEKRGKSVGVSFKSLSGIFAGIGIGALAVDTFKAASSMQSMSASLKTVMGSASAASSALAEIKEFAKTTPFDLEQSVKGFIKLKALGLDPSIASLRSYGNTAAAMGKSLNQAVEAVADAATGEFERLKEFGIKAKSQGDLVTFTFQGVATTIKKEASAIEGYLQGIGNNNFGSAMADQMDTLGAQTSNLRGAFFELQVAFFNVNKSGDGLAGSAGGAIKSLTKLLESDGAIAAVEALGRGLVILIDATALALTGVSEIFSTLKPIYTQASVAFDELFSSGNDVVGVMDVLKGVLTDSKLVGIALVTGLLTGFEDIKGGVRIAGEAIKLAFLGSFDLILEAYAVMLGKVGEGLDKIPGLDGQAESLKNFSTEISNIITPLDNYKSALARIKKETELSKSAIRILTDEQADLVIQTITYTKEVESATKTISKNSSATSENSSDVLRNKKARDELIKSLEETTKNLSKITKIYGEYSSAADLVSATIRENSQEQRRATGIVEELERRYKSGAITLREYESATGSLGVATEKTTTVMADSWERFKDSAFSSLETFYKNGLSGGKNFTDSIKDLFKDMVASVLSQITALVAANAFKKFINFIGGNTQTNGFFDGVGALFSGSSGSNGGLFGGNSSGQNQGGLIQTGAETLGNQFGLTSQQSQDILSGVASAYTIYNGYNQIKNGNAIGGGVQLAGGGVDAYNTIQRLLGGEELSGNISGGIGLAGNAFGIYNGIKQGGVAGYGQAGVSGLQAFNTLKDLGLIGNAAGASAEFAGLADYYNSTFGTANAVASGVDGVNTVNATTSGSSTLGTASTALGVAAGAYNIYGGLKEGGTAGYGQAAGGAITAASSLGYLSALGPYGAAIGAVISILAGTGGARTPQELGLDQLEEVDQATKAGRNENVELGQAAGKSVSFIGGFDERSTFFGVDLARDKLQEVGDKLERFGFDEALALKDGIIRLEDKDRNFSENNERIVSEVKSAIVEVELSITELERTTIGSLGGAVIEVDALFDSMRDNGKSSADNLASAFAEAFDTTIEAGHDWVNSTAIDADRIAEIFDNSSAGVSEALFGVSADGIKAFEDLSLGAINQVGMISGSIGNLGTAANDAFLLMQGGLNDIQGSAQAASRQFIESQNNLRVVQGGNDQRQSDNSNEASQQQAETNDILARTAKALEDTAPFIRQAAARAASGQ